MPLAPQHRIRPAPLLLLTALAAGALVLSCTSQSSPDDRSRVVATVDGAPIVVPELRHFMRLHRAEVYNHFYQTHDATYDRDFWTTDFGDTTPLATLRRRSLQAAIRYKVQQNMARNRGVDVTRHYDSLMAERTRVNEKRAQHAEEGAPVFGAVRLTRRDYLSRVRDEMVNQTITVLSQTDFALTTSRLKALYANRRPRHDSAQNEDGRRAEPRAFNAFTSVYQRRYAKKRYKARIDSLTSSVFVRVDSALLRKIQLDER